MSAEQSWLESLRRVPVRGDAWTKLSQAAQDELDEVIIARLRGDLAGLSVSQIYSSFLERYPAYKMSEMTFRRIWNRRLEAHTDK